MSTPEDNFEPSPEFARDIKIFDAEPWTVRGPIDNLIDLQQQAFQADYSGNRPEFGAVVMEMSRIESSIGNHSEAAAYADEAAAAFTEEGLREDAIAAHATLAREHRTLDSPSLALASLAELARLKVNWEGGLLDVPKRVPDEEVMAIVRLVKSFTHGYLSTSWVLYETGDGRYPTVPVPKGGERPAADAVNRLGEQLVRLNAVRGAETDDGGFDPVYCDVNIVFKDLSALRYAANYRALSRLGRMKATFLGDPLY
jgi:hypothetical protein